MRAMFQVHRAGGVMKATVCPDCVSRDAVCIVVFDGECCRRCGAAPAVRLTPREIRTCLRRVA